MNPLPKKKGSFKAQVRPAKTSCFFEKKSNQELGGKIETFFKPQICNIENSDFRKKPIVDFQKKFSRRFLVK